jgi:glycosyltransferase involved in cell wall biosynthesis
MRVAFVGNGLYFADDYPTPKVGGSVQTWGISRELAKSGNEVYIIRRSNVREVVFDNVRLLGIDFFNIDRLALPFWHYISYASAYMSQFYFSKKSFDIIRKIKPHVVSLIDRFTGIFPLLLKLPKIFILHVPEALDFFKPYSISINKLNIINFSVKNMAESKIMRSADKIVVLNRFIERHLKGMGYKNIIRIPNGVDAENFWNKGDEGFILYAGRFDWNKNVSSLVDAFVEVYKSYPDYKLFLIGTGPEEEKIRCLVRKKGLQSEVKILPWMPREKFIELMCKCSFFVLPSLFEVNPVVILEAMASGKTVVARANMGTVDIIRHGENGYLYRNKSELRNYLELFLSDSNFRTTIGQNARKIVEKEYTFGRIAEKYETLFQSLLNNV